RRQVWGLLCVPAPSRPVPSRPPPPASPGRRRVRRPLRREAWASRAAVQGSAAASLSRWPGKAAAAVLPSPVQPPCLPLRRPPAPSSRWIMKCSGECKYTEEEAKKLGVVGWVKNTSQGTVTGQVQGPEDKVNAMKSWLSKVGSPSSRIDRTSFSNEKEISKLDFSGFSTRY
uniref:Acylphosphatase-2 n=1 Tax=Calidris pygmaea TaxID=425635 RepID=A0A8C3JXZ6_9CHAR